MSPMDRKFGVEIKALDDAGAGLARIATLSAIDADGDTYAPGAFGEQHAKVLAAHDWQTAPIGKARVFEQGDEALAEFRLNLETAAGREWHAALKFDIADQRPLQEWSYGFQVIDAVHETRGEQRVRVLKKLRVFEVSPVVLGAGVGTATLDVKGSRPFAEQIEAAIAELDDLAGRAAEIAALRKEEGRELSAERLARLAAIKGRIEALLAAGDPVPPSDLRLAQFRAPHAGPGDESRAREGATAGRLAADFERIRSHPRLR